MKEQIQKTIDGGEVKILIPENAEDEKILQEMIDKGEVSTSEGMAEEDAEDVLGY